MKNKITKIGSLCALAVIGVSASTSSYLASSKKVGTIAASNQATSLKKNANDDYVVLWDNPDPNSELSWSSDLIFNSSNVQDKSTLMAAFPAETWENVIKNDTFYLDFYATKKQEPWEQEPSYKYTIKITNSWWDKDTDYSSGNPKIEDIDENNHTLELKLTDDLASVIDDRGLLFTGGGYIPQRIYYGTKPTVANGHYVNIYKRESNAYKNHGYITVDNEIVEKDKNIAATVNYEGDKFDFDPHVTGKDSKQTVPTTKTETGFTFTMPDEDVYITAEFYDNDFVVSFSLNNGGHGRHEIDQQVLAYGNTVVEPESPLDDFGFIFLGWFKEGSCVNGWNFEEDKITCDTTLYAKWREILRTKVVVNEGAKTEYEFGENLDLSKIKLELQYNKKGEYEEGDPQLSETLTFDINQGMIKGYDKYKSGAQTIGVDFNGKLAPFNITIADFDVALKSKPTKVNYSLGDPLNLTGAKLTLTAKSGSKTEDIDVTPDMISGYDSKKTGKQTVTITLNGKTFTFDVTVGGKSASGGIPVGALVGGIIGGAVGGAGIALAISLLLKKKKAK